MSSIFSDRLRDHSPATHIMEWASPHFRLKSGHVQEAVAYALGYRTRAALLAAARQGRAQASVPLNLARFAERYGELCGNPATAYAVAALAEGARLDIQIQKHPPERNAGYTHTQYAITASLTGPNGEPAGHAFHMPEFTSNGVEPYRVDSWWSHRAGGGAYTKTRARSGNGLLTAKFVDGVWRGELFIYAPVHQHDDANCLKAVRAALARAVLPGATGGVHVEIYRPDAYDYGAWRVEMTLGHDANAAIASFPLIFTLPAYANNRRHVICESEFRVDQSHRKFSGASWQGDLYSNGVPEDENPIPIATFRRDLLRSVHAALEQHFVWTHATASLGQPRSASM